MGILCLLTMLCVCTGQRVEQIMDLVNAEEQSFSFFVVQSSLLCDDQQSSLTVHPMTGTVASKDKLVTLLHNWSIKISVYCFKIIIPGLLCVELTNHYGSCACFFLSVIVKFVLQVAIVSAFNPLSRRPCELQNGSEGEKKNRPNCDHRQGRLFCHECFSSS